MEVNIFFWIGFHIFVFSMLALDLGVFNKNAHKIEVREALTWSGVWISLAMIFNVFVLIEFGRDRALEFLAAYVVEYSLSVDNIFVFILIFTYFSIQPRYQHKILFWGILGALVMRGVFIFAGITLISKFHWIILIFGGFLVITGVKMIFQKETSVDPERNAFLRAFRRIFRVTDTLHGDRLFIRENGKLFATPLFMVLLVIESSDLIFAVDSIPAVLAISKESFIVYTSNVFAILGLRSLYFAMSGIMGYFRYLKIGLAFVLSFVGVKMLLSFFQFEIPILLSLAIIIGILLTSVMASLLIKSNK